MLHGLDDLMPILSEAELWLGMFQDDEAIRKAAISLTVAIIDAIERSIGFFISKEGRYKIFLVAHILPTDEIMQN